jgi:hypothetical protein
MTAILLIRLAEPIQRKGSLMILQKLDGFVVSLPGFCIGGAILHPVSFALWGSFGSLGGGDYNQTSEHSKTSKPTYERTHGIS